MNTVNETGPHKGSYLFTPFESRPVRHPAHRPGHRRDRDHLVQPGARRLRRAGTPRTGRPGAPTSPPRRSGATAAAGCTTNPYGRLFELTNPLTAGLGHRAPAARTADLAAPQRHPARLPRGHPVRQAPATCTSSTSSTAAASTSTPPPPAGARSSPAGAGYFDAGQTFVLRVGNGNTPNATGAYTWVPITDAERHGPARAPSPSPTPTASPRSTAATPPTCRSSRAPTTSVPRTCRSRPSTGVERLYMTTTTTNEVYALDLDAQNDLRVRQPHHHRPRHRHRRSAAASPAPTTSPWTTRTTSTSSRTATAASTTTSGSHSDLNHDGDLTDAGEGIGRWASNGTPGSEFTGLYFDPTDKRRAWVNIQHPASGNDRTIEITLP